MRFLATNTSVITIIIISSLNNTLVMVIIIVHLLRQDQLALQPIVDHR